MGCTIRKSHVIASAVCTVHENVGVVLAIVLVRNPPPPPPECSRWRSHVHLRLRALVREPRCFGGA